MKESEILPGGMDELGVFLYGHAGNAYWYGSQLTIEEAAALAPCNTATTLQVSSAVLAAMVCMCSRHRQCNDTGQVWALENPRKGVVEADDMDHERVLDIMAPYLGKVVGVYTDWTPMQGRQSALFPDDVDVADPWQFANVLAE